jgi:hypothetical protein
MFEVGDRVVCVDDGPFYNGVAWPLRKGATFVVLCARPPRFLLAAGYETSLCGDIGIGEPNPVIDGIDSWPVSRFRKLRDISQSLFELKALTINCPPLVGVDA